MNTTPPRSVWQHPRHGIIGEVAPPSPTGRASTEIPKRPGLLAKLKEKMIYSQADRAADAQKKAAQNKVCRLPCLATRPIYTDIESRNYSRGMRNDAPRSWMSSRRMAVRRGSRGASMLGGCLPADRRRTCGSEWIFDICTDLPPRHTEAHTERSCLRLPVEIRTSLDGFNWMRLHGRIFLYSSCRFANGYWPSM
jgi:hypothetical protein